LPRRLLQVAMQWPARRSQGCEVRASSPFWTPPAVSGSRQFRQKPPATRAATLPASV